MWTPDYEFTGWVDMVFNLFRLPFENSTAADAIIRIADRTIKSNFLFFINF